VRRFLSPAIGCLSLLLILEGCSGLAHVEPDRFTRPKVDAITFWGHACLYIDVAGSGIVTDPVFEKNLWQRRRFIGAPPDEWLRNTRVVLISHAHDDHLSPTTLAKFPKDTVVLCPAPAAAFLAKSGIPAKAMKPGEEFEIGGARIVAVAVHHPGTRRGIHAAVDGRALGWVIVTPTSTIFYSGDTNYCSTFADVGWTYAPDIAIINVNGHLRPDDASRAAWATQAPVIIPAHWGAYGYWIVGGNRRPRGESELKRLIGERLHVLNVGESFSIEKHRAIP
jgi:L-ascorbate metabolism protein UlaG (beta-lactamase superfamily)